jgi:hypothetical protein
MDDYLGISAIANDTYMTERMRACVIQQMYLGTLDQSITDQDAALNWVGRNSYVWAASPSWSEKWASALASHPDDPEYEPGKDVAVITDEDILATVQALIGNSESEPET